MSMPNIPTVEEYWRTLKPHIRGFAEERGVAIALYRELAKGQPVDEERLGGTLGITAAESRALLQRDSIKCFIYSDARGRVVGFGGLATAPMHHRFEVDGRGLWTWCAWGSLFIPEILGRPARVASRDPESGELVQLVVTPQRIESAEPDQAVISFIRPDAQAFGTSATNVMAKFCHFIFFFASPSCGQRWVEKNPGTFLYSPDDAFALGKLLNAHNFGSVLALDTAMASR